MPWLPQCRFLGFYDEIQTMIWKADLNGLRYLLKKLTRPSRTIRITALKKANVDVLQLLKNVGYTFDEDDLILLAEAPHSHAALTWMLGHMQPQTATPLVAALYNSNPDAANLLKNVSPRMNRVEVSMAQEGGIDSMKWMVQNGY